LPAVLVTLDKLKDPNSGLGQFCVHLARSLATVADPELDLTFLAPRARFELLADLPVGLSPLRPWRKERVVGLIRPLIPQPLRSTRHDLWHVTNQDAKYLPLDRNVPVLLTIHDLNFLRERGPREQLVRTRRLQRKVDRAAAVATISQFVAREITAHLDLGPRPLRVVPNGVPPMDEQPARPPGVGPGDFLFYIGHINPRKNLKVLVSMMSRLPDLSLYLAGNRSHSYAGEIESEIASARLDQRIRLLGEVSDGERAWLYRECRGLVFPSLTEGFGLPVVEAMQHGKPVFLARTTSLPEVAGDLGNYWDSFDPDQMAAVVRRGLEQAASDPELGDRLRHHASGFSWDRAARVYAEWYRELSRWAAAGRPSLSAAVRHTE